MLHTDPAAQVKRLTLPPLPGLLLTALIAWIACSAGKLPFFMELGLSPLTLAIVMGIIVGNIAPPSLLTPCHSGITLAKQRLLRLGIILYGFRLTFQQIAAVGAPGVLTDLLTLSSTFLLACWLGQKLFHLDRETTLLIGAGHSICGAAAIIAAEPVVKAESGKVTVAVSTVVLFGTVAIFVYPWLYHWILDLSGTPIADNLFGIYIGSTVHEVAQVVAAGEAINTPVADAAVI
ncbi:MAG: YeiH family protein, partial [Enterobacteriaceae bacterium]